MTQQPTHSDNDKDGYRPDIDGLRAVAVLAVLLFHLGITSVGGGYVGVDVFFVITGYLFGKFALTPLREDTFDLREYYERRAKRLFPAFLATMLVTSFAAFAFLLPLDLINFWKSLQSAFFFISNVYFANTSGYFDTASTLKPILHAWSLSVESQFYFLFPIVSLISWRWKKSFFPVWMIGIASFIASIYLVKHAPTDAYYLLTSRAWEILLGAYIWHVSSYQKNYESIRKPVSEALGLCGLAFILAPIFLYTPQTKFPGISALVPCAGAALLLLSGVSKNTSTYRILSLKPLVYVGKISYSLYLVHWPIIVFSLYTLDRPFNMAESALVPFVTIALAAAMHHLVETPFRKTRKSPKKNTHTYAPIWIAVLLLAGFSLHTSAIGRGYNFRIPKEALQYSDARNDWTDDQSGCPDNIAEKIEKGMLCKFGHSPARKSVLLWGDSHATALLPAIKKTSGQIGVNLVVATTNGCPPVLGVENAKGDCLKTNKKIESLIKEKKFSAIIMAANWGSYNHDNPITFQGEEKDFSSALAKTINTAGTNTGHVILVDQVPRYAVDVPNFLAKEISLSYLSWIRSEKETPLTIEDESYIEMATPLVKIDNLDVIVPKKVLCPENTCLLKKGGISLYKDGGHISAKGSDIFVPAFTKIMDKLK